MTPRSKKRSAADSGTTRSSRRGGRIAKSARRRTAERDPAGRQRVWAWFLAWLLAALLAGALIGSCSHACAAMSGCIDATCRITTADGGRGSGCVFEISQGYVYVLTAAHVVGEYSEVSCEFWRQGYQSVPVPGRVIVRVTQHDADAAIVALDARQFGSVPPDVVPLAPRDYVVRPSQPLMSAGCAHGAWSTGWKGHALGYRGRDLYFTPPPAQGRSGSALFDADGKYIVGLVRARTLDDREGIACSLQALYEQVGQATTVRQVQCGPNGCVPLGRPQQKVLPYRQEIDQTLRTWPTPPPVDLGPTNARIDALIAAQQGKDAKAAEEAAKRSDGPNPIVAMILILAAIAVGGVAFFATQNHTG